MTDKFMSWVRSGDDCAQFQKERWFYYFVRVSKDPEFDYIYFTGPNLHEGISRGEGLQYLCLYCRKDGEIYDVHFPYVLSEIYDAPISTFEDICKDLRDNVREIVERKVNNDRDNLSITELSSEGSIDSLEYFRKYRAKELARRRFLTHDAPEYPRYTCEYRCNALGEKQLLEYILDPESYARREAEVYLNGHQEDILLQFLKNDAEAIEYDAMLEDPHSQIHIVKAITQAMCSIPEAKTVHVTIYKEGKQFAFKTEALRLRVDCLKSYSKWDMPSKDRGQFEKEFGRHAEYTPQEIVEIKYGKKTIYKNGDMDG